MCNHSNRELRSDAHCQRKGRTHTDTELQRHFPTNNSCEFMPQSFVLQCFVSVTNFGGFWNKFKQNPFSQCTHIYFRIVRKCAVCSKRIHMLQSGSLAVLTFPGRGQPCRSLSVLLRAQMNVNLDMRPVFTLRIIRHRPRTSCVPSTQPFLVFLNTYVHYMFQTHSYFNLRSIKQ